MRSLNLSSTDIDGSGLKYLSPQRKLFSLVLAHTQVCRGLESVADLPELYLISLDFTPLTDEAIEPLSRSISLNEIYFRGTEVTDEGLMQLAKIPSLRRMLVANSKVTPEGIQRLKAIRPDVATD